MRREEAIALIREYENSVDMPEEERVTALSLDGHVCVKGWDAFADDFLMDYGLRCREYLRFGDEVDLATCGGYNTYDALKICNTPEILLRAGFAPRPMLYTQKHLFQALAPKQNDNPHRHGLTAAQVKRFPEFFESPAILANSPARDDVLLAVLPATDADKLPLIAGIKPDGKGNYELSEIETNMVLSVYGKRNFPRYFQLLMEPATLVYIDTEKSRKLERLSQLQLLGDYPNFGFDTILQRPSCLVNKQTAGQKPGNGYDLSSLVSETRDALAMLAKGRDDGPGSPGSPSAPAPRLRDGKDR